MLFFTKLRPGYINHFLNKFLIIFYSIKRIAFFIKTIINCLPIILSFRENKICYKSASSQYLSKVFKNDPTQPIACMDTKEKGNLFQESK